MYGVLRERKRRRRGQRQPTGDRTFATYTRTSISQRQSLPSSYENLRDDRRYAGGILGSSELLRRIRKPRDNRDFSAGRGTINGRDLSGICSAYRRIAVSPSHTRMLLTTSGRTNSRLGSARPTRAADDQIILSDRIRDGYATAANESLSRASPASATVAGIMFNWRNSPGNLRNDSGDA